MLNIVYKEEIEFTEKDAKKKVHTEYHIGSLEEKIKLNSKVVEEINIRKVTDYTLDPTKLFDAISRVKDKIERIEYCLSPEFCNIFETGSNPPNKIDFAERLKEIAKKDDKESYFKVKNLDIDKLSTGA